MRISKRTTRNVSQPALSRRFGAFTLIELVVVIAIISILAAMFMPSLAKAKEKTCQAACKNNLKQFNTAHTMYSLDYAEYIIPIRSNANIDTYWFNLMEPYCPNITRLYCTSANRDADGKYVKYTNLSQKGPYGLNASMCANLYYHPNDPVAKLNKVKNPSMKFFCIDGAWYYASTGDSLSYVWDWHDNGSNIAFFDGHVTWWKNALNTFMGMKYIYTEY